VDRADSLGPTPAQTRRSSCLSACIKTSNDRKMNRQGARDAKRKSQIPGVPGALAVRLFLVTFLIVVQKPGSRTGGTTDVVAGLGGGLGVSTIALDGEGRPAGACAAHFGRVTRVAADALRSIASPESTRGASSSTDRDAPLDAGSGGAG